MISNVTVCGIPCLTNSYKNIGPFFAVLVENCRQILSWGHLGGLDCPGQFPAVSGQIFVPVIDCTSQILIFFQVLAISVPIRFY